MSRIGNYKVPEKEKGFFYYKMRPSSYSRFNPTICRKQRRDLRALNGFLNSYSKDPATVGLYANIARRRRPQFGPIRRMYKAGNLVTRRQKIIAASIRLGMNESIYNNPRFNRADDLEVAYYLLKRPLMRKKCIAATKKFFGKRKVSTLPLK